jgi:3-dehydroquinate synthase
MEFTVDNFVFKGDLDLSDEICIKSLYKNYNVYYSNKSLNSIIKEIYNKNDFIFIDKNVYNLDTSIFDYKNILVFDAIENNKNIENVLELTDKLYAINFTKQNKLIVIGGGITQDVGGFAAAIYKRGINWVFVPTTILSMTDSCIGSKVSINRISKNILGMFIAPDNIYISNYFLNSLREDDVISGIGEALKLSLIGGKTTYNLFLQKYKENDYISIIKIASLVKRLIIEDDEFEKHSRKVLNYGHTIGHAIESTTNYYIPHGTSVLIGMYIKNKLFYGDKYEDINNLILNMVNKDFFDIEFKFSSFIQHILSDKKNRGNDVCFILLDEIGNTKIIYKNVDDFYNPLQKIIAELFQK